MATVLNEEHCQKNGEKLVCNALKALPDDWIVYAQPTLIHENEQRFPDFVILGKELGFAVLEVKDWVKIEKILPLKAYVWDSKLGSREEEPPHLQARKAAHVLVNKLQQDKDLINHTGKLPFPYRYIGVLPFQPLSTITQLSKVWGEGYILGESDLKNANELKVKLLKIPVPQKNFTNLTQNQFDAIRAAINPQLILREPISNFVKGILDELQEKVIYEPLILLQEQAAKQAQEVGLYVRLVRGVAGTGKTDVLILRAKWLAEEHPEKTILVTTYNKPLSQDRLQPSLAHLPNVHVKTFDALCAELYMQKYHWSSPQDPLGVIANLETEGEHTLRELIKKYGKKFISDEIVWMKESGRTTAEEYINLPREGRGSVSDKTLSKSQKHEIFSVYEAYEEYLKSTCIDWVNMRTKVWELLQQQKITPPVKYDAIFIDEAQHFAPRWIDILKAQLKENTSSAIFLCEDPTQSVFRYFSWKQKGLDVVGRTKWFRKPYRTTQQIFEAAYALIKNDELARSQHNDLNDTIEELDCSSMRQGVKPQVFFFPDKTTEILFITQTIQELLKKHPQKSIAVLHTEKDILNNQDLKKTGVVVDSALRQTGMEYNIVFIPDLERLFTRDVNIALEEEESKQRLAMYMLMTRARDMIYLCCRGKFPKLLAEMEPYVEKIIINAWNSANTPSNL